MKKIILFILVLAQMGFVVAQSLIVTGETMFVGDPNMQIEHHLDVKNISGDSITIKCQKTNLNLPLSAESYYCFAGNCYSSTTTISSPALLDSAQQFSYSNSDLDAHTGYYDAFGASGIAEVQYCFYDVNNPTDETCVTITYETIPTSIDDYQPLTKLGDFYPNPANEIVNFTFNGNLATLKLIDILGNNVKEILLNQKGIQELDLSDMNKGIYFGNLIVNDEVVSIKKLIVK
jgi:hypothetical protein